MSEVERMLKSEQAEQKRTARSARNRRCGSKSKHCSLPSDSLSTKERAALSGPVTTYDGTLVSWETFLSLNTEEKTAFINRMQYLYKMDLFMLSSAWNLDMSYLNKHLTKLNIKLAKVFPTKEDRERFAKVVRMLKEETKMVEPKYINEEQFIALTPEERTLYVLNCMRHFKCGQRTLYAYLFRCTFDRAKYLATKYTVNIAPEVTRNLHSTKCVHEKLAQWSEFDARAYSSSAIVDKAAAQIESAIPNPESATIEQVAVKPAVINNKNNKKLTGEIEYTGTIQEAIEMLQHLSHVCKDGQVMVLINL